MNLALEHAQKALDRGEIPVGAVVVRNQTVIAACGNETEQRNDPTAHAEILAIQAAAKQLDTARLADCDMYVTLEPCPMCAQAISFARIRRLYFGAYDPKGGGVDHGPKIFNQPTCHHQPEVFGGIMEEQCSKVLKIFFQQLRTGG